MTTLRKVTKQLACIEDLNLGNGTETQTRNGTDYTVTKFTPQVIIDDIADLANVNEAKITCVFVQGFYDVNDGGGGVFTYDATADAATHDGGTVIDPTHSLIAAPGTSTWWTGEAGTGVWKRVYNGYPNIKWFGSTDDETTDLTTVDLANASHMVNLYGKVKGKQVFDSTLGKLKYASGTAAGDPWNDLASGVIPEPLEIGDPGSESSGVNVGGVVYPHVFRVNDIGGSEPAEFILHRHSTTIAPLALSVRSNSNDETHSPVTTAMPLYHSYHGGWTGSHYDLFGGWTLSVGTGTVSGTSSPGKWTLQLCPDGSNTLEDAITVDSDKSVALAGTSLTVDGKEVVTEGTDVSGYVLGGAVHLVDDYTVQYTSNFDVDSVISTVLFESVGPTGSGATNIWAQLDDMPATAKAARIKIVTYAAKAAATIGITVYTRAVGDTTGQNYLTMRQNVRGYADIEELVIVDVPVNENNVFEISWAKFNTPTTSNVWLYLEGWIE